MFHILKEADILPGKVDKLLQPQTYGIVQISLMSQIDSQLVYLFTCTQSPNISTVFVQTFFSQCSYALSMGLQDTTSHRQRPWDNKN